MITETDYIKIDNRCILKSVRVLLRELTTGEEYGIVSTELKDIVMAIDEMKNNTLVKVKEG